MTRLVPVIVGALLAAGCSRSNNVFLGRVEATVGGHTVVVTDCYRTSVPKPERLPDEGGQPAYRFVPCRDAEILLKRSALTVNGKSYGAIGPKDGVLVDHGVVSINRAQ